MEKDKNKSVVDKIKNLINFKDEKIELAEITLPDGTVIMAEKFEVGEAVFIVKDDERIPLPVGEYDLGEGKTLIVSEEGIIAEIKETAADPDPEMDEALAKAIEKTVQEIMDKNSKLEADKKELEDKLAKVKVTMNKSKIKGIRANPEGVVELTAIKKDRSQMTYRERVHDAMTKSPFYGETKLATTTTIDSSYAGEFAGQYIAAATLQGVTLGANAITIKENIKYEEVVKRVATTGLLADQTCDFTPTGDVDIDERILKPKPLQINLEFCKADFQSDWDAVSMGYSAFDILPPSFQSFFAEQMALIVNEGIEINIYQGVATNDGEFDGFGTLMAADTTVLDVDNTGVTIDATTVVEELGRVVDAIPQTIYNTEDLEIKIAPNIARAYMRALGGFGAAGLGGSGYEAQGNVGAKPLNFDGVPLFVANGLKAGEMIAAQKRNLWYGTGLLNDKNDVQIIDMAPIDGSKNVRFIMRFTAGVQFGVGAECVYYWSVPV